MSGAKIVVSGLREFRNRVLRASGMKDKEIKRGLNTVGEVIIHKAQLEEFPSQMSSDPYNVARRTGELERSLRGTSTATQGKITEGIRRSKNYAG